MDPRSTRAGGRICRSGAAALVAFVGLTASTGAAAAQELGDGAERWWSLRPLQAPEVPAGAAHPVDAFVEARARALGLEPGPEADRRTLARRIHFDLVGLPPGPDAVDAFVADPRPDAWERLVDRLLASPHHGERQARRWLDLVHFGETHGFDKDKLRPNAWPYRDWVIDAFDEDLPYAEFVEKQIAGDVLYPGTADGIVALGFLAAGPWDFVGHVELRDGTVDKAITRNLDRDDMVHTTMSTFVSTTAACARCHDHEFDPIPQRDYYALQAVFAGVDRAERPYEEAATDRFLTARTGTLGYHSAIAAAPDAAKWVQVDLGRQQEVGAVLLYPAHEVYGGHPGPGFGFPRRFRVELSGGRDFADARVVADRTAADVPHPGDEPLRVEVEPGTRARFVRVTATSLFERAGKDWIFAFGELVVLPPGAGGDNLAAGQPVEALDSIEAEGAWGRAYLTDGSARRRAKQVYAVARAFRPRGNFRPAGGIRPVHRLHRGEVTQPRERVGPGALSVLEHLAPHFDGLADRADDDADEGARRAALARWITDPGNPLTWRSIVNRVWQDHFGRGLVTTPNDFGRMGAEPSHPELLDWLAVWFRDTAGGSLKQLRRLLVTSRAYRRAASARGEDEATRWFVRGGRRRLSAEEIRDAVLSVSGKLDPTRGGPSVRWFAFENDHSPRYDYEAFDPDAPGAFRRSIYRHVVRSVPDPFFETLDCADPSALTPQRFATTTPLQALAMANDRFVLRQAQHFADRVRRVAGPGAGVREQVWTAWRLALARVPRADELGILTAHAERHGLRDACRLLFNLNEFVFLD